MLKEIIGSKKESTKVNTFCFGNREVTDEFEIANLFNNYFVNIGPTLEKKIANNNASPLHYLPDRKVEPVYIQPTCAEEVLLLVKQLKSSWSGLDSLSTYLIKKTITHYIDHLVHTINHDVLLQKLNHYGIRGICLQWINIYLTHRKQRVLYNGIRSSELEVKCGVPQVLFSNSYHVCRWQQFRPTRHQFRYHDIGNQQWSRQSSYLDGSKQIIFK